MNFNSKWLCMALAVLSVAGVSTASDMPYEYDGAGNIKRIGTDDFVYDWAGRLIQSETNGMLRTFAYDRYGNRTFCDHRETPPAGPLTVCQPQTSFGTTNRLPNAIATYDASGNLVQFEGHTYTYDAFNMQTRDTQGNLVVGEYIYTADDERIAVYVPGTGSWRWSLRDASGKVLREMTSADPGGSGTVGTAAWQWTKDYVYRDALLLASRQIEPGASAPSTYHYHLDHLGSPRRITNDSGDIAGVHDYHPFGPEPSGGKLEPSFTRLKYTGHERDGELDYMHARFYDRDWGRFLSPDPLDGLQRFPQSWNRYAYARNNPLKYIDPTGLYVFAATCADNDTQCKSDQTNFEQARQQNLASQDSAVRAAAAAYGDPGQENGVTVAFGNLAQGTAGQVTPMLQGNADGTVGMTASVMFQTGLSGTNLRGAVGHEGQHILDAQGFIASFAKNPLMDGGLTWDIAKNLTVQQTETNAYRITHSIFRMAGLPFGGGCQGCNLGTAAQTPADVNLAITRILTNPAGPYAAKLNNRQHTGWDTPPQPKP